MPARLLTVTDVSARTAASSPAAASARASSLTATEQDALRPTPERMRRSLENALSGIRPAHEDAETLLYARGDDLDALLEVAGRLRDEGLERAGRPGVITYSRKVFIPLTHLCQDRCHYCIFVQTPGKLAKAGISPFLSEEEVLEIARQGAAMGCKEALFTLGDRPENRWAVAREWLAEHGYATTLEYMRAMAIRVLEETGLLPHLNPGVMTWAELQRLKPAAPSMGMMLETTSVRLWAEKGQPHFGSPDKDPAVRLRVIDDAGRSQIPFTTGVLLGIGETVTDRVDAMFAIRDAHERWGHVQEVIVQNFRAKDATAMMHRDDLAADEYAAAVAVTRLVLGPDARVQAPPNLTDHDELALLIRAGIDDWGGVSPLTPDHVNPERPWPQIEELARLTGIAGYRLRERLTTHPHFVREGSPWVDPAVQPHLYALADDYGLADETAPVVGRPWSLEPTGVDGCPTGVDGSPTGVDDSPTGQLPAIAPRALNSATQAGAIERKWRCRDDGRDSGERSRVSGERSQVSGVGSRVSGAGTRGPAGVVRTLLDAVRRDPAGLEDTDYIELLGADGDDLEELATLADAVRRDRVGDEITHVVNRNIDSSLLGRATPQGELTLDLVTAIADDAASHGATEVCVQGRIGDGLGASAYLDVVRAVRADKSQLHVHAYRPIELLDGARRLNIPLPEYLSALREAGVGTVPGTGARILDDRIRDILSGGTELPVAEWVATVEAAHRAGLRSTATMVYGHIETPADQVAHLRTLVAMQRRTGGFTEFIAMPFVPQDSPVKVDGTRPGPSLRESRAVHAVARLMLAGSIDHVQAAWTKLGFRGTRLVLAGGVDDLGGVLIDGDVAPWAGPEQGRVLSVTDMRCIADEVGRPLVQRTTTYERVTG
ncbi:bifunctional FO biosynthesis protein CofGH [Humibacter soli]